MVEEGGREGVNGGIGGEEDCGSVECVMGCGGERGEEELEGGLGDLGEVVEDGDGVLGRGERVEVGVGGDMGDVVDDDEGVIGECEGGLEVVYVVVCMVFEWGMVENGVDGIGCGLVEGVECVRGEEGRDIVEGDR